MSMSKKEQAEFAAAKKAVIVARALNWTEPVERDVPPPAYNQNDTLGYTFNTYDARVMYGRSSSIHHATSDSEMPQKTRSQRPLSMYSTKLLALKALRHAVECECAEKLARIDMDIAQERAK